jgi:AraC-like DNA-binding protein
MDSLAKERQSPAIEWANLTPGVSILNVRRSEELWKVYHDSYCIAVVQGGAGRWKYRGHHHAIQPKTLMLSEPGEVHTTTAVESPGSFTSLFIEPEFLESHFAAELGRPIHFRTAQVSAPRQWQELGVRLSEIAHRYSAVGAVEVLTEQLLLGLGELFAFAAQHSVRVGPKCTERMERAREAIVDNYKASPNKRLSIAALAAQLGVSRFWLTHEFKKHFGCAPNELHTLLRVAKAKRLVTAGGDLWSVAQQAGYCDQSQMTREFNSHWGITPGKFQQLIDSSL